jgi:exonuclease SbcC
MIIKTLTLINYRKFRKEIIDFPDGITGVVGLNGVGKSTIFESIAWVLYGSVAARTGIDQIKRSNSKISDPCKVILDFQFEDDAYTITRELSGKNCVVNAKLIKNSKLIATGSNVVNKHIQKKLGMDFKSFYTSIFAKQKELNALSTMNPSERRPLILKMLGIDSLDSIIRNIKSDIKTKKIIIEKLIQELTDEKGNNKIDFLKKELENLKNNKKNILSILNKKEKEIKKNSKKILELTKKYNYFKKEFEKQNLQIEHLNEKKILFEKKNKLIENIKTIENKIEKRNEIIKINNKKLDNYIELNKNINLVDKKIKNIDFLKLKLIRLIEEKKTLKNKIKNELNDELIKKNKINKIGDKAKCPTCDRILGDQYNKLITKYNKNISNYNKKIDNIIKEIEIEKINYEKILREKNALDKKKNYLFNQLRIIDNINEKIKNNQEEINNDKKEIKKIIEELRQIKDIKIDYNKFNILKIKIKENYSKYQIFLKKIQYNKDNNSDIKLSFQRKKGEYNLIKRDIFNKNEKIKELRYTKKNISKEKIDIRNLKMLNETMDRFRSHLILRIRPILSSYAADFFSKLTNAKYQDIELDDHYNIKIYDKGIPYNIKRFSGGEEDLANLCLRLSISELITERAGGLFNFIILDEIFGSQDIIHQKNIMKALQILSSKFKQIILITHVNDIKNHVENIISVNESENGISSINIE